MPRMVRAWHVQHQGALLQHGLRGADQSTLLVPAATHTYEEGLDGAPVLGDGVVATLGLPTYSATEAVHDSLGWTSIGASGGGRLVYDNPSTVGSSGSVYVTPHNVAVDSPASVLALLPDASGDQPIVRVRLREDGSVEIVDVNDAVLALSDVLWATDRSLRLDWEQLWDGSAVHLTVWLYTSPQVEGWRPNTTLDALVQAGSPANIALGHVGLDETSVGFDTYREYGSAGMPAPYRPAIGVEAFHSYDDGTSGDPPQPGNDDIIEVAGTVQYSSLAAKHGPIGILVPPGAHGGTR